MPSMPPSYQEITIVSCGAPIVLSVWERSPHAGGVLFYPATMASPLLHVRLLQFLWEAGLNVVGVHPLSHGKSPRVKKLFRFQDLLQNGLDAAAWMRQRWPGPLAVTGHSQGGILTLAHALADRNIQAAFPLCTLLPQHPDAIQVTRFSRWQRHRERIVNALRVADRFLPGLPIPIPAYLDLQRLRAGSEARLRDAAPSRLSYPLRFITSLFTADLGAACEPGNIRCPLTLIVARDDALFTPELSRVMLDCIQAPAKELLLLPSGGHLAPLAPRRARQIAEAIALRCAAWGVPLVRGEME